MIQENTLSRRKRTLISKELPFYKREKNVPHILSLMKDEETNLIKEDYLKIKGLGWLGWASKVKENIWTGNLIHEQNSEKVIQFRKERIEKRNLKKNKTNTNNKTNNENDGN